MKINRNDLFFYILVFFIISSVLLTFLLNYQGLKCQTNTFDYILDNFYQEDISCNLQCRTKQIIFKNIYFDRNGFSENFESLNETQTTFDISG